MTAIAAAVAIITALGPLLAQIPGDIQALIAWIESLRAAAQQSNEWTDAAESVWRQSVLALKSAPENKPDATAGGTGTATPAPVVELPVTENPPLTPPPATS